MEKLLTSLPFLICGLFHVGYTAPNVTGDGSKALSIKFITDSPSSGVVTWDVDVSNLSFTHTVVRLLCRQEYDNASEWTDWGLIKFKEGLFIINNLKYPYAVTCVRLLPFDADFTNQDQILGQICNRTFDDVPSKVPQDFKGSCQAFPKDHTQREATFRWKPIPRQHQNGVIIRYQLRLESANCDLCSTTYTIEPNTTTLHIRGGLSTRVTYLATLVAYNAKGASPPTYYRLAPLNTVSHADRLNTIVFILLVIIGLVMGAWWARHNPRTDHKASTKELYKDSSAYKQRQRRAGVTQNAYQFSRLNNNNV